MVTFAEIPDEISLCVNISNCPCHCVGCHSSHLAQDIGEPLTVETLKYLIEKNKGITCVSFMGGDSDPSYINYMAMNVKFYYPKLKVAWYSGRESVSNSVFIGNFNYVKIGPYIPERGPLDNPNTNQILYQVLYDYKKEKYKLNDITFKMQTKNTLSL